MAVFDLRCTDKRHAERKTHDDAKVRAEWDDGVFGTTDRERKPGEYTEVCVGCDLANKIDDVPELRSPPSMDELIEDLTARVAVLEGR